MLFLMRMVKLGAILPRNWLRRQTACVQSPQALQPHCPPDPHH